MKTPSKKYTQAKWRVGFVVLLSSMFLGLSAFVQQAEEWKAAAGSEKVKNPFAGKMTPAAKDLYVKNCIQCHGPKGKGDGPKAEEIEKAPQDISTAKFNEQTDGAIFWKMSEGKKPMPSFKAELSEEQRWQLVNYLRSLGNSTQSQK